MPPASATAGALPAASWPRKKNVPEPSVPTTVNSVMKPSRLLSGTRSPHCGNSENREVQITVRFMASLPPFIPARVLPSSDGMCPEGGAAHFWLSIVRPVIKVGAMSAQWTTAREYTDIKYETTDDGSIAKITINRPQVRNAFRPQTVHEMLNALNAAHEEPQGGRGHPHRGRPGRLLFRRRPESARKCGLHRRRRRTAPEHSGRAAHHPAPCPSLSSPWWPAMPSAEGMSSTSSAT